MIYNRRLTAYAVEKGADKVGKTRGTEIIDRFIVLEGLDGAGTTTQRAMLTNAFQSAGIGAFSTFEPTDGPAGQLIRKILAKDITVTPGTMARLFVADRHEHLYDPLNGIISHIGKGEYVLCDRYLFSSLAYQSRWCGYETVRELNGSFPLPERCVFLDVPPEECQRRMHARGKMELYDEMKIQRGIIDNYERALSEYVDAGGRIIRLDGTLPKERICEAIWSFMGDLPILKL